MFGLAGFGLVGMLGLVGVALGVVLGGCAVAVNAARPKSNPDRVTDRCFMLISLL